MSLNKCNVAVIMSVYKNDSPSFLELAINSIIEQSHPCDLYIYCDGMLTPELYMVLNNYSVRPSVTVLRSDINNGLAFALNVLIDVVLRRNYDFVARMDSDDISRTDRISKQVIFLIDNKNIALCGAFCSEFGSSYALSVKRLPIRHDELLKFSITRCPLIHPTVMFRTSLFKLGYRYPIDTPLTEDMAFWFQLLQDGIQFGNVDEVLLDYRLNENTIERRKGVDKSLNEFKLRLKYMRILNETSFTNFFCVFSRLLFHLLPSPWVKVMYKYLR
jgi:hypothetical protein